MSYYSAYMPLQSYTTNKLQEASFFFNREAIIEMQEAGNLHLTSSQPALPSQDGWLSTFSTALALKNKEVRPCRANAVHVVGSLLVAQRGDDSARKAPAPKLRRKWAPRWPECLPAAAASCKKETLLLMKSNEGEEGGCDVGWCAC